MGHENGASSGADGCRDLIGQCIVCGDIHIDKDRDQIVLDDGVEGRGEAGGHGDDLIARL